MIVGEGCGIYYDTLCISKCPEQRLKELMVYYRHTLYSGAECENNKLEFCEHGGSNLLTEVVAKRFLSHSRLGAITFILSHGVGCVLSRTCGLLV